MSRFRELFPGASIAKAKANANVVINLGISYGIGLLTQDVVSAIISRRAAENHSVKNNVVLVIRPLPIGDYLELKPTPTPKLKLKPKSTSTSTSMSTSKPPPPAIQVLC